VGLPADTVIAAARFARHDQGMDESPDGPQPVNRFAVTAADLESTARVPVAEQVASVDPDRGASLTSSADWADMRWLMAGDGAAGASLGTGLALGDGDGD
jgi:hypothetical protein